MTQRHRLWVRICHWLIALSFLTLATTGYLILMVHPRLYWGDAGNDLMPALLELPISDNHRPEVWQQTVVFTELANAPFSANRTDETIFNENGWGRSLHFLAGWLFVLAGAFYAVASLLTGHVRRDLLPRASDLSPRALWQDLKSHLRPTAPSASFQPYGVLQRSAYASAAFLALPLMVLTGLTMSPAVTAAAPWLLEVFGGHQSARTLHFFGFTALVLFLLVHVAMVVLTGARRQLRAMILGS